MPLKVHGADTELCIHKALRHLKNSRVYTTNPQPATKLIPTHSTTTLDWGNQNICGQPRLHTVDSFTPNTPLNLWTYALSDNLQRMVSFKHLQRMVSFKHSPQTNQQLPVTCGSHQWEPLTCDFFTRSHRAYRSDHCWMGPSSDQVEWPRTRGTWRCGWA